MKIRRCALAVLLAGGVLMSQLSGCGGGGSSGSAADGSASTALSGMAMAGPFLTGQACAYRITGGAKGALLGTCANLASSAFNIDIGSYTGDVLVEIAAGATYDDEANPNDNATGTVLTGALRSLIHVGSAGGSVNVSVTPLTEAAVRMAGATLDAATVQAAITQLLTVLPTINGLDLRSTVPVTSTNLGLAYREMLRALSQLQWVAGGNAAYTGGLDAYLAVLIGQIGSNGNTVGADLLTQLGSGLNGSCTVNGGALSCTISNGGGGGGGGGGVTCDTSLFVPGAVQTPTANELASFARTYAGSEGSFDVNFNFVASGAASLVFNANGSATYNSAAYTPTSHCLENLNGGGQQLVIHAGNSHFDLRSNGAWNGVAPNGSVVNDTPYGGGGGGATGVTLPNGNSITNAATITYQPIINVPGGKIITFTEGAAKIELYDYVNTLGVGAGDSGMSIGITPYNACALNPSYVDANTPACANVGVSFDRSTGQASFTNTPMHPIVFTCPGTCEINGALSFTPY